VVTLISRAGTNFYYSERGNVNAAGNRPNIVTEGLQINGSQGTDPNGDGVQHIGFGAISAFPTAANEPNRFGGGIRMTLGIGSGVVDGSMLFSTRPDTNANFKFWTGGLEALTINRNLTSVFYDFQAGNRINSPIIAATALLTTPSITIGATGTAINGIRHGVCTLVSGVCTVTNSTVTNNSRIFLTGQDNNVLGVTRVSARSAGASFVITSSTSTDSGVVAWQIIEP